MQLNQKLYGQHLAIGPLVKHLRGHFEGQPKKATVLSLHGPPGTGKNFVSRMLVDNLYVKGMDSNYVHLLSATKDFPHESMLEEYKVGVLKVPFKALLLTSNTFKLSFPSTYMRLQTVNKPKY